MYQVKVMNRQNGEVIMESDTFSTMAEADELVRSVGQGEGYYSMVFKLNAVWSDLVSAQSSLVCSTPTRVWGRFFYCGRTIAKDFGHTTLDPCVRTNKSYFIINKYASYTLTKYSDFCHFDRKYFFRQKGYIL